MQEKKSQKEEVFSCKFGKTYHKPTFVPGQSTFCQFVIMKINILTIPNVIFSHSLYYLIFYVLHVIACIKLRTKISVYDFQNLLLKYTSRYIQIYIYYQEQEDQLDRT